MINIDGSQGEGGGQVLRTSLALSTVTGMPFRIESIRAGRPRPGLMRQHLTSVQAACAVCSGTAAGAELGSSTLEFTPGEVRGGDYAFAIGTAGSTTLVLQTILPALMTARGPSTITISGGTHNMHAPTVHFLERAFLPIVRRMGPSVCIDLLRHGFHPAGGGVICVNIEPVLRLQPIELLDAAPVTARRAIVTISGLPGSIAKRELAVVRNELGWSKECLQINQISDEAGPGNILSIEIEREDLTEVFTGFGERGVSAERVAARTIKEVRRYLDSNVLVWRHLADQLMLPMAIAGGGAFQTCSLSDHATTNAKVIESFLSLKLQSDDNDDGTCCVRILS